VLSSPKKQGSSYDELARNKENKNLKAIQTKKTGFHQRLAASVGNLNHPKLENSSFQSSAATDVLYAA